MTGFFGVSPSPQALQRENLGESTSNDQGSTAPERCARREAAHFKGSGVRGQMGQDGSRSQGNTLCGLEDGGVDGALPPKRCRTWCTRMLMAILAWTSNKIPNSMEPVPMDVGWVHNKEQDENTCRSSHHEDSSLERLANRKGRYEKGKGKGKGKGTTDVCRGRARKRQGRQGRWKRRLQRNLPLVLAARTAGERCENSC